MIEEQDYRTIGKAGFQVRGLDPLFLDALALRAKLHRTADTGFLQGQRQTKVDAEDGELSLKFLIVLRAGRTKLGGNRHGDALGGSGRKLVIQHLADARLVQALVLVLLVRHDLDRIRHTIFRVGSDDIPVHIGDTVLFQPRRHAKFLQRALARLSHVLDEKGQTEDPIAEFGILAVLLRELEPVGRQAHVFLCEDDLSFRQHEHNALGEHAARPCQAEHDYAFGVGAVLRYRNHRRLISVCHSSGRISFVPPYRFPPRT